MSPPVETMADTATRLDALEDEVAALRGAMGGTSTGNSIAMVCFSGDWDKLYAAFTVANGALAMGQEVHMFFTFWGASAIRDGGPCSLGGKKTWIQRLLGRWLPASADAAPLSRMNCFGISKLMFRRLLREKGADDLPALVARAREFGAKFYCCDTSLQLFGWGNDDLLEGDASNWCGVSTFLNRAMRSNVTLFV